MKTTGIFCRPSCPSKAPLRRNVEFFDGIDAAYARGWRPCKRCRPDLPAYDPDAELLSRAQAVCDRFFDDDEAMASALKALNISRNHLIRLFRRYLKLTPVAYLRRLRIQKALQLLANPNPNILEIALSCGFGSLSHFYACFKKEVGLTPAEYRGTQNRSVPSPSHSSQ